MTRIAAITLSALAVALGLSASISSASAADYSNNCPKGVYWKTGSPCDSANQYRGQIQQPAARQFVPAQPPVIYRTQEPPQVRYFPQAEFFSPYEMWQRRHHHHHDRRFFEQAPVFFNAPHGTHYYGG